MPRSLRPLDPASRPEAAFAAELRKLYEDAGKPKFLQMARKTGKSRTALSEAVGGDHLPTWETVAAFVAACGGKPNEWRARWEVAREQARATNGTAAEVISDPGREPVDHGTDREPPATSSRARSLVQYALVAVVSAAIAVGVTTTLVGRDPANSDLDQPASTQSPATSAVITVQNKVAVGADELIEDAAPSYLSTEPKPFCTSLGCRVEGTELESGAALVALCYVHGTEMFNYNLDSSESKTNPHRARSTLWYKAVFPDGRSGYISEVYIAPSDRGGVGLPICED